MWLNYDDENLRFLKEKIKSIRFAIFRADIHSEISLPNNIIEALKVDDDGTIWFITSCIGKHSKTVDRTFYANLDFYRKGSNCRLQLSGKATVVEDDDQAYFTMSNYSNTLKESLVLIKMKIMQAEYFEHNHEEAHTMMDKLKVIFHQLFVSTAPPHRIYDFS
jgi:general stress protein 26